MTQRIVIGLLALVLARDPAAQIAQHRADFWAVRAAAPQAAAHARFACLHQRLPGEVIIGTACVAVDHNTRANP